MKGEYVRFLIFGDSKGKKDGINTKVLKSILNQSIKLKPQPEFIIMCGDSVAGSDDKESLEKTA